MAAPLPMLPGTGRSAHVHVPAGRRLQRVRRTHHLADHLPGVLRALDHEEEGGAAGDERDQVAEEGLVLVLLVMAARRLLVDRAQLAGDPVPGSSPPLTYGSFSSPRPALFASNVVVLHRR